MVARIRMISASALALAFLAAAFAANAQDYPARPITIVVPQAPAAASDLLARTLGERLGAAWGQPVIIDNRPGAGGNVGAAHAARAQPDGYTLMIGTDAMMTSNIYLYKNMPFHPVKEKLASLGLAVAPSTPGELAALVKEGLSVRGALVKAANIQAE